MCVNQSALPSDISTAAAYFPGLHRSASGCRRVSLYDRYSDVHRKRFPELIHLALKSYRTAIWLAFRESPTSRTPQLFFDLLTVALF